ncbi:MAG: DEAD/DEAH box helicase [Muribaculaceae bacterium]|nr:DEAD/DEAH box helicase [Muribaculaceae bacterium]
MRFDELNLSDDILDALDAMNFEECTPIQEQAIDIILDGYDLIACAQTGTGKTAAYVLPVIDLLAERQPEHRKVRAIVMVPTHELAQQIDRQLEGFSYYLPVSSLAIHGGNDGKAFARQQHALRNGADMVIATPGRLLAHIKMGYVDLSKVEYFILDEADRMLDMGFYDDIMRIVAELPRERQTLMFSATMPKKIQQLAASILYEPKEVKIAVSKPAEKVDQSVYICHEPQKEHLLKHLFEQGYNKRVIVFSSSKLKVRELSQAMRRSKWKTAEMHSDLDQAAREEVMHSFRAGRIDILIATDIIARGIDIDDIEMVVNYDVPHEAEDYVHRVGRTARANADGKAVTFVSERDQRRWAQIEKFLEIEVRREEIPAEFGKGPEYKGEKASDRGKRQGRQGQGRGKNAGRSDKGRHTKKTGERKEPAAGSTATPDKAERKDKDAAAKKQNRRRWHRKKKDGGPDKTTTQEQA